MRILIQSNLSALCFSVHVFIEEISCLSMFGWKNRSINYFFSLKICNERKDILYLQAIGFVSTKKVNFLCVRLAQSLQKIGCASTKKTSFLCLRLAQSLQKMKHYRD